MVFPKMFCVFKCLPEAAEGAWPGLGQRQRQDHPVTACPFPDSVGESCAHTPPPPTPCRDTLAPSHAFCAWPAPLAFAWILQVPHAWEEIEAGSWGEAASLCSCLLSHGGPGTEVSSLLFQAFQSEPGMSSWESLDPQQPVGSGVSLGPRSLFQPLCPQPRHKARIPYSPTLSLPEVVLLIPPPAPEPSLLSEAHLPQSEIL